MRSPAIREPNRLFVAAELPGEVRRHLADIGAAVTAESGGRPVAAGNLHVTLAFVGPVPARRVPPLLDALGLLVPGPAVRAGIGDVAGRPSAGRARLAAVELDDLDGGLAALAARVSAAAGELGDGGRRFWPHVTVARFSRPTRVRRSAAADGERVFDIDRVSLYDSHMTTGGPPRYEPLMEIPLDGSLAERKATNG